MYARSRAAAGFTIVEVMIFLAISGLMFVLAINAMSGKQQSTEFQTGVETLRSELTKDLSGVSDGNYDLPAGTNCYASSLGPQFGGSAPDGSCNVIGEVISFRIRPNTKGNEYYAVFPVIGNTYKASTTDIATSINDVMPRTKAVYVTEETLPYGLTIDPNFATTGTMPYVLSTNGGYGAIGLFSFTSFEGGSATTGSLLNSGSEHVEIFPVPKSSVSDSDSSTVSEVASLTDCGAIKNVICHNSMYQAPINPMYGVSFCAISGTNGDSALFTIGGSNSPTSVSDQIYNGSGC